MRGAPVELSLPKTRAGRIALAIAAVALAVFLYFFTGVWRGHAIEVTVVNGGEREIFASIDNTGRHGENTEVVRMHLSDGALTSPGIRIQPSGIRSLGLAVGLFDSPTLHVWEINPGDLVDASRVYDCAFDTFEYRKFKLPSLHVKLKWTGHGCERNEDNP